MTEDELRAEAKDVADDLYTCYLELRDPGPNYGRSNEWDILWIDKIMALCKRMQAQGLQEVADYATDCKAAEVKYSGDAGRAFILAFHKVAYWAEAKAKEREEVVVVKAHQEEGPLYDSLEPYDLPLDMEDQ
jgi:hypothetical protein